MMFQGRSAITEKRYLAILREHGRCTVSDVSKYAIEGDRGTRDNLKRMVARGAINAVKVGHSWEYWVE